MPASRPSRASPDSRQARAGRWVAGTLAGLALAVALAALAGWLAGIPRLYTLLPGNPALRLDNALALALASAAVLAGLAPGRAGRWLPVLLGAATVLVGVVALASLLTGHGPLGAGAPPQAPPAPPPGAPPPPTPAQTGPPAAFMSEMTSACFLLLGLALALGRATSRAARVASDTAAVVVGLVAIYVVGAFAYGAPDLAQAARMPLPTAATLLLVCLAHVLARPQAPAGALLLATGPEGRLARRLLPAVVVLPLLLGYLTLNGEAAGWFTAAQGTALHAFAVVVLLGILVVAVLAGLRREHRAGERARERFARVFEASPVGIALSKPEGTLVDGNEAMARILGVRRDELRARGAGWWPDAAQRERMVADAVAGSRGPTTLRVQAAGGAPRVVDVTGELVDVGGETLLLSLVHDVTERERGREERDRRQAAEAELERLRRMDEFRADFINHTAHELGTPLTPVVMQVHMLESTLPAPTPPQRKALDAVQRGLSRLEQVVRDVVEAARAQAGKLVLDRSTVDLGAEVQAAVAAVADQAKRQGVALEAQVDAGQPLRVEGDAGRLRLALGHLLGNAVKFTPSGGRVKVGAYAAAGPAPGSPPQACVWVEDSGIGIDAARLDGLWKPYSQVHDKGEVTALGAGLGLYVTRTIVEHHGGAVGASSAGRGKGSKFWFTLPAQPPAAA